MALSEHQQVILERMSRQVVSLTDEYIGKICREYLDSMKSILEDIEMNGVEKLSSVVILANAAWKKLVTVIYENPNLTPEDVINRPASTGDEGMDRIIEHYTEILRKGKE